MEARKMVLMNLFSGQQWRHRHREQTYIQAVAGRRERVQGMEKSSLEMYIPICKIDSQWELAL